MSDVNAVAAPDVNRWRGKAPDEDAERSAAEASDKASVVRLRSSSRRLLGSLLRPHRRLLSYAVMLLLAQNAAGMAGPYLVKLGIDRGIPPLTPPSADPTVLIVVAVAFAAAATATATTTSTVGSALGGISGGMPRSMPSLTR